jgi:hypothetical protein
LAAERLEQDRGAELVDRGVLRDLVHALPDADRGRQVDDRVDRAALGQRPAHRQRVAHVAAHQLDLGSEVGRAPLRLAVDLGQQAVEDPDPVPPLQQEVGEVRADEAGAAGDQDPPHPSPLGDAAGGLPGSVIYLPLAEP